MEPASRLVIVSGLDAVWIVALAPYRTKLSARAKANLTNRENLGGRGEEGEGGLHSPLETAPPFVSRCGLAVRR